MGWKSFFKVLWKGTALVASFAAPILAGISLSPAAGMVVNSIIGAIQFAEQNWPEAGTGVDKFNFVMSLSLDSMERATGKNVNNPKTRALLADCINLYVEIMNLIAKLRAKVVELNDVIKSVKDPAIDDAPTE